MADTTYQPKVYKKDGGDTQVIASGGKITIENGGGLILPTADPGIAGAWWDNNGTLTKSAG